MPHFEVNFRLHDVCNMSSAKSFIPNISIYTPIFISWEIDI